MDEKERLMMQPYTVTLNDAQWSQVLLALSFIDQEIGKECPHPGTVYKMITSQMKAQGKEFAK